MRSGACLSTLSITFFSVCFCCLVTGCHDGSVCKNINMLNTRLFKLWSVLRGTTGTGRELLSLVTDLISILYLELFQRD